LAPKNSYICRKEILNYEVDVFSQNPRQEKEASRGAGLCKIEG